MTAAVATVGLVLAGFSVANATDSEFVSNHTSVAVDDARYSAEDLVDGLVFNAGPVAEDLGISVPLPENLSQEDLAQYNQVVAVLKSSMWASDRVLLEEATSKVTSGDPYQVEAALATLGMSLQNALDEEYPGVRQSQSEISPMCGLIAVCGAVSVAAVALGAAIFAVAYNVAGAVNIIYEHNGLWTPGSFTGNNRANLSAFASGETATALSVTESIRFITVGLANK